MEKKNNLENNVGSVLDQDNKNPPLEGDAESVLALARARGFDTCPICMVLVLEKAVITAECGHKICEPCLTKYEEHERRSSHHGHHCPYHSAPRKNNGIPCPTCKSRYTKTIPCALLFRDAKQFSCPSDECDSKGMDLKEFGEHIRFFCPSRKIRCKCGTTVPALSYDDHLATHADNKCHACSGIIWRGETEHHECPMKMVNCSLCNVEYRAKKKDFHLSNCEMRIVQCSECGMSGSYREITIHEDSCSVEKCKSCKITFRSDKLVEHRRMCSGRYEEVYYCQFSGCSVKGDLLELFNHYISVHKKPFYVDTGLYKSKTDRLFIVSDKKNNEYMAKLMDSDDEKKGKFSYIGWPKNWDEWIDMNSPRIFGVITPEKIQDIIKRWRKFGVPDNHKSFIKRFYDYNLKEEIIKGKFSYNDVQNLIKIDVILQDKFPFDAFNLSKRQKYIILSIIKAVIK